MYGGDEVSAIVVDLGSHTCKAGYAGEDAPKAVFPSVVGAIDGMDIDDDGDTNTNSNTEDAKTNAVESDREKGKRKLFVGSQALNFRRDQMEIISPIKDGIVADWDMVDNVWDHAFRNCLMIDPKEHPMLLAEPSLNTQQQREKAAELMFEKYKVPALFMAKNPVLTSFASGRATSLVVDCGGGSTTISPVHDGYVLQKAVVSSPIGGDFLTDCLLKSLESKGIKIKPRYSFKRKEIRPGEFQVTDVDVPDTTESYRLFCQRMIVSDVKDSICRVPDTPYDDKSYSNIPMTSYELPDGQTLEIGADRFKVPDVMFNPSIVQTIPGMENYTDMLPSVRGLPNMEVYRFDDLDGLLKNRGFQGVHKSRTGEASDGCSIFWKDKQFKLLHHEEIEFDRFGLRNNVAQLCVLEMNCEDPKSKLRAQSSEQTSTSPRRLVVGNIHVLFNPKRGDIKLGQVRLFLESAYKLSQKWGNIPVAIAGDLNSTPKSAIYDFIASADLDTQLHDRRQISGQSELHTKERSFRNHYAVSAAVSISRSQTNEWSQEELQLATGGQATTHVKHELKLHSAYTEVPGTLRTRDQCGEPLATTYHSKFLGTVDYIWHTKELVPVRVLETLPTDVLRRTGGLPSEKWGSDHLAIACELGFVSE